MWEMLLLIAPTGATFKYLSNIIPIINTLSLITFVSLQNLVYMYVYEIILHLITYNLPAAIH